MEFYRYFTQIMPDFPMTHTLFLGKYDEDIVSFIQNFTDKNGWVFDTLAGEAFDIKAPKYREKTYQYDTVILNADDSFLQDKIYLFEHVYDALKNAGGLILIIPKLSKLSSQAEEILEKCNFVAINPMDIDVKKDIFYAKKMHGWGGFR